MRLCYKLVKINHFLKKKEIDKLIDTFGREVIMTDISPFTQTSTNATQYVYKAQVMKRTYNKELESNFKIY